MRKKNTKKRLFSMEWVFKWQKLFSPLNCDYLIKLMENLIIQINFLLEESILICINSVFLFFLAGKLIFSSQSLSFCLLVHFELRNGGKVNRYSRE